MSDLFRRLQTSAWQYLNYGLACNTPSEPNDINSSVASRLAQLMLTTRVKLSTSATDILRYHLMYGQIGNEGPLPRCDRPEDWTDLSQWKHPELDLNLLQVAIVCRHPFGVMCLWQDCFKEKEKYLDASSKLVNHPWHLIFALRTGYEYYPPIEEADVEVFLEEGKVDLKTALLREWPSTTSLVEPKTDILLSGSKVGLDWLQDGVEFYFFSKICCKTVEKLFTAQAQPSTVECLWKLVWDNLLYRKGLDFCLENLGDLALKLVVKSNGPVRRCRIKLAEECLILICQLWFKKTWSETAHRLCRIFCEALKNGIPIRKAASFLQPSDLRQVIECMTLHREVNEDYDFQALFEDFEASTSAVRTLQNLCVLPVLRAVNGDVRKVWDMSDLTEPAKTRFHVPFQALHDKLKADN